MQAQKGAIPLSSIKMTKKLLSTYRKTKSEIPLLESELAYMQQEDHGFGNSVILDYRTGEPRAQAVVGFDWARYGKRQQDLQAKKARCQAVESWITEIDDVQARMVFRMYYIDGMTWTRISNKIGYVNNPDYPRLHIRDAYLKKMGIK
jgi:hypothetical protein